MALKTNPVEDNQIITRLIKPIAVIILPVEKNPIYTAANPLNNTQMQWREMQRQ